MKLWIEIEPKDAVGITLPNANVQGPYNETGEPCPWPWDPIQLQGAPLGQYHCKYCGAMVIAGKHHLDYGQGDGYTESHDERTNPSRPQPAV